MAYKICNIQKITHPVRGLDYWAFICTKTSTIVKIHLPRKYLFKLSDEQISQLMVDIETGHNPYIIFREKLLDDSYRLDLVEKSKLICLFKFQIRKDKNVI